MNFTIKTTGILGINSSVVNSGNSFRTELREETDITDKDWIRAERLGAVEPGLGHDTFLNGIIVNFNIIAPLYWWKQAQRYHWLEFVSSQSTMHCVLKFDIKEQCVKEVDDRVIEVIKELITNYNNCEDDTKKEILWKKIIASLPCGFCLGASMTTNYRQLKTICKQRKGHRLSEWKHFISWCKTLPYFVEHTNID